MDCLVVIAIDGKTSRRSGKGKKTGTASHIVTAFAARRRLVLGQVKVADESNEIAERVNDFDTAGFGI